MNIDELIAFRRTVEAWPNTALQDQEVVEDGVWRYHHNEAQRHEQLALAATTRQMVIRQERERRTRRGDVPG